MKRFLPSPLLSVAVFALWLLLVADFSAGHMALGAALAIALPLMAGLLRPQRARFGKGPAIARLAATVSVDIVLSNIEVARRILGPQRALRPGFIWVPLELTSIHGITALASIITLTPGTVSAELTEDQRHLLVHCFDLDDPQAAIDRIKTRYEAPLKEIFP
ncbi:MAG TPA: Na+/H+ antiporter subunit E [Pseudoxanthomonas sp.]|nr:Na+/H+ antiporter subunit E [Pseudoxanthomonas sp.]